VNEMIFIPYFLDKKIMGIEKPFKRNVRPFIDGKYDSSRNWKYILHKDYVNAPIHYIRAYLVLQKDFLELLDYIEPADINLKTYSFRIHSLFSRICMEIEANFVAILSENEYRKQGNWNIDDFKKVNETHHLSSYIVKLPVWKGEGETRRPFEDWANGKSLTWYRAYNKCKHNRSLEFEKANFEHLTDAICALIALLSSQFLEYDYSPLYYTLSAGNEVNDDTESTIGNYFRVKYPKDWTVNEIYTFKWDDIKDVANPIDTIKYK